MDLLSPTHLLVIAIAGLVLFTSFKRLPGLTRTVTRSRRIFRTETSAVADHSPHLDRQY